MGDSFPDDPYLDSSTYNQDVVYQGDPEYDSSLDVDEAQEAHLEAMREFREVFE
jgi:hypothetical protein